MADASSGEARLLSDYVLILVKRRGIIILNFLALVVVSVIISLVAPSWYKSSGSLLPAESTGTDAGFLGMMQTAFPLLQLPGVSSPTEMMVGVLSSRLVAEDVIRSANLTEIYRAEAMDEAVEALRDHSEIVVDRNGVLIVSAEARDPARACLMVEVFIDALDRYNSEIRSTSGKRLREFVEGRLDETRERLAEAEDRLVRFQKEHVAVEISEQAKAAIQTIAELEGHVAAMEIRLGVARRYASGSHPEVVRLESELGEYRKLLAALRFEEAAETDGSPAAGDLAAPLSSMPALAAELARLTRDVEILNRVYLYLVQEQESARIQEAKDTPTIQILDRPVPAEIRDRPKRKLVVGIGGLIGLVVGIVMAFFREFLSSDSSDSRARGNLETVIRILRGDVARIRSALTGSGSRGSRGEG